MNSKQVLSLSLSVRRYPSVPLWSVWESLHAALLSGVSPAEDPRRPAAVRIPPAALQDLRVRGLRLHLQPAGRILSPRQTAAPQQPGTAPLLPQTHAGEPSAAQHRPLHAVPRRRTLHVKHSATFSVCVNQRWKTNSGEFTVENRLP